MIPAFHAPNHQRLPDDNSFIVVPPGYAGLLIRPERPMPRVKQHVSVADMGALEEYLGLYATPSTLALYVDHQARTFHAVLDHFTSDLKPGTNHHQVKLTLRFHPEFEPLHAILGVPLNQTQLLNFLDENASLFQEAARLRQFIETFESVQITRIKSVRNLDNGTAQLVYGTTEDDEQTTKVPRDLTAKVSIFHGHPATDIMLRLRYATAGGNVVFTLLCFHLVHLLTAALEDMEHRLRTWLVDHSDDRGTDWKTVPVIRVQSPLPDVPAVAFEFPQPERVLELKTPALPPGFGGGHTEH